jgi:hypothetical protein
MIIFIKLYDGKTIMLDVKESDSINIIKKKIKKITNISIEQQKLVFNNIELI